MHNIANEFHAILGYHGDEEVNPPNTNSSWQSNDNQEMTT
jgi:hypothetical protein